MSVLSEHLCTVYKTLRHMSFQLQFVFDLAFYQQESIFNKYNT